ncbi:DUF1631 domain-containing protein [Chitinimonas sp. BJYL2]|uniref:DUF1631 domain-containing protein n=1 Tax=Chitinimonas sp. BJYL2 TaxID=2976696 RepID=UPI0022B49415|nr:DUF1631 domain-containing protein [Chitinimonas sp. BJYL2]
MDQKPESLNMLMSCRDLAADLLSKSLKTMLDRIEESLFDLADKALDRDSYNMYMEARSHAQTRRSEIEAEFRRRFVEGFDRAMKGNKKEAASFDKLDFDNLELSLVAEDEHEEDLAAANIATKLKSKLGDELNALNFRIGHLMQLPEESREDNPMSPQAVVDAFRNACMKIESDMNVRLLVLRQFEQLAAENVPNVYQKLNSFLVQRNIMPVLPKAGFRRRAPNQPRRSDPASPGQGQGAAGTEMDPAQLVANYASQVGFGAGGFAQSQAAGSDLPAYAVGNEQELLGVLQQLLSLNQMQMMQGQPGLLGGGSAAAQEAQPAPVWQGNVGQSFLDTLNLLQQGRIESALSDPGELDAHALAAGSANILHQIKTTNLANSLGHVDAMTIDIVAMLFDNLFDDRNIPAPMKALIGRLQIPVLKVAMLDSKFFARKQHPTRRLLDRLAEAALGWDEADGLDDRLYRKIAALVERIVVEFDENIDLFDQTFTELEQFLVEEELRADESAEAAAAELAAAEREELAAKQAEHAISQKLLAAGELPDLIRDFARNQWQIVLRHAARVNDTEPQAWPDAIQAFDDLCWSVTPKVGVEERLKLVNLLPKLLRRLERATEDAGVDRAEREAFFAELVHSHANAIKSGLKQGEPPAAPAPQEWVPGQVVIGTAAPPPAPTPAVPPAPVVAQINLAPPQTGFDLGLGDLPAVDMESGTSGFELSNSNLAWDAGLDKYQDYDDVVSNQLKRGAWVEFTDEDGNLTRAKLAWVSPRKSRFLFTNRQGENGLEFTLQELIEMFRRGDASLIESGPSVERAVSSMIGMFQAQAA